MQDWERYRERAAALQQQVVQLNDQLAAMLSELDAAAAPAAKPRSGAADDARSDHGIASGSAEFVRSIGASRRLRNEMFGVELFVDPAWDMMLALYLARLEQRSVTMSAICNVATVPAGTARRYLEVMLDRGLIEAAPMRKGSREDRVALSDQAARTMAVFVHRLRVPDNDPPENVHALN